MLGLILKSISHFIRDINNGTGPLAKPKNFPLKLLTSMQSKHPDFIDLESFNSIQPIKIHIDFREGCNFYKEKKNKRFTCMKKILGFPLRARQFISSNILMISLLLILPSVVAILCW